MGFFSRFLPSRPVKVTTGTAKTRKKVARRNKNRVLRGKPKRGYRYITPVKPKLDTTQTPPTRQTSRMLER